MYPVHIAIPPCSRAPDVVTLVNPFFPTVPTFAVRETASHGIMGAPEVPPLCRETQSLGQQMLNAPLGINGLTIAFRSHVLTQEDKDPHATRSPLHIHTLFRYF